MPQERIGHSFCLTSCPQQFVTEVGLGPGVYGVIAVTVGHEDGNILESIQVINRRFLFDFIIEGPVFFHVHAKACLNKEMGHEPVAGAIEADDTFQVLSMDASYAQNGKTAHGVAQDEGLFAESFFDIG